MSKLDVFVMALFVRFYYMSLSLLIKHLPHVLFISLLRKVPYLFTCFWVFWNNLFMEERLPKRNTIYFGHCHVNELAFLVATHVIIAKVTVSLHFDPYLKLLFGKALFHQIITDTNSAILNKIHVRNFIFLIKN